MDQNASEFTHAPDRGPPAFGMPWPVVVWSWRFQKGKAILLYMATIKIKSTYSLDVETVRQLEDVARRWNVSKSEVLRRAIRSAAALESPDQDALDALDRLQRSMNLTEKRTAAWAKRVREERAATRSRTGTPQG